MKTKSLIAALLFAASSAFAQVPSYVPTNGLVGWWPFNGNANDESGNGNNGTVNGATLTSDRFGNSNAAYNFNGINNYISLAQPFFQGSTAVSSFTYHVTIKIGQLPPNSNTYYAISAKEGYWRSLSLYLTNDGRIIFGGSQPYNYLSVSSTPNSITLNQWTDIVITFENSNLNLFVNGLLSGTSAIGYSTIDFSWPALGNSTSTNLIGASYPVSPGICNYFEGIIDDFGTWNRVLSQQEIIALYNAQTCNSSSNTITPDGPTTFCAGNSVNLKSDVAGGTYQWKRNGINITTNATSRTFKASTTGSYTCVATCNGTALTSNAIAVTSKTNASATVTASGATSFCLGDSLTLNCTNLGSNYSVQWYRTNVSMENATNYSLVVKQPGTYKVVTRNLTNGCSRISGSAITTSVNCRIAGDVTSAPTSEENTNNASRLIDNELSHGVHIYPNPNNGSFNFTYDGEETGDGILQIINTMGQSIYSSQVTIQEGGYTQEINLGDNYTKGFYIVRLLINGGYNDSRVMVR
jgi:hypothetical protein